MADRPDSREIVADQAEDGSYALHRAAATTPSAPQEAAKPQAGIGRRALFAGVAVLCAGIGVALLLASDPHEEADLELAEVVPADDFEGYVPPPEPERPEPRRQPRAEPTPAEPVAQEPTPEPLDTGIAIAPDPIPPPIVESPRPVLREPPTPGNNMPVVSRPDALRAPVRLQGVNARRVMDLTANVEGEYDDEYDEYDDEYDEYDDEYDEYDEDFE